MLVVAEDAEKTAFGQIAFGQFSALVPAGSATSFDKATVQRRKQGPKLRRRKHEQRVADFISYNKFEDFTERWSACCFLNVGDGVLKIVSEYEVGNGGLEFVSVLIASIVSGSDLPRVQCQDLQIKEDENSRTGFQHEVMGGHGVPNEGEKDMIFVTQQVRVSSMNFKVADVNDEFESVAR